MPATHGRSREANAASSLPLIAARFAAAATIDGMPTQRPRLELDRTVDIDPYTEPKRYAAAVEQAERDFAELDDELARLPADEQETALGE